MFEGHGFLWLAWVAAHNRVTICISFLLPAKPKGFHGSAATACSNSLEVIWGLFVSELRWYCFGRAWLCCLLDPSQSVLLGGVLLILLGDRGISLCKVFSGLCAVVASVMGPCPPYSSGQIFFSALCFLIFFISFYYLLVFFILANERTAATFCTTSDLREFCTDLTANELPVVSRDSWWHLKQKSASIWGWVDESPCTLIVNHRAATP